MRAHAQKTVSPAGAAPKAAAPAPDYGSPVSSSAQVLQHLLRSGVLQAKLTVSQPGDPLEEEADRVAETVMRMPAATPLSPAESGIQRKCSCSAGGHTCDKCSKEEEKKIQRKDAPGRTPSLTPQAEAHVESLRGGGQSLPGSVRSFFEPRFGRDFSGVRIRSDSRANETASAVQARAFTLGRSIVFGLGQYAPDTQEGRRLLAHELVHVAQQGHAEWLQRSPAHPSISEVSTVTVYRKADANEAAAKLVETDKKPKDLPPDKAAEVGQDALRTLGYERILALAEQAGFVRRNEESSGKTTIQRAPDPSIIWRDAATATAVLTRYAIAAGIASQADTPAPGPGDVVAIGILIVGLAMAGYTLATSTSSAPVPSVPIPAPAPPVSVPVPAPPTAVPVPVAPPVPVSSPRSRDTTQERAEPRAIPRVIPQRRGRWSCEAQCNIQQIRPGANCPDRVVGFGTGHSEEEACREAKRAATQSTPAGCYPRHCRCFNCVRT